MKDLFATLIIMLFCITALAQRNNSENTSILPVTKSVPLAPGMPQEEIPAAPQDIQPAVADNAPVFMSPLSVQVLMGSQGVGADVKYGISPKLSGRLGFGIMPVDVNRGFGFSGFAVAGQFSGRFSNIHLLADYSLFNNQHFRLVGGASYLVRGNANVIITPTNGYTIGRQSLAKDQIGAINADVTWKGAAPYLGAALFNSFPNRLFNINLDVGTYYLSRPGTSFTGTKLLTDNDADAKQFNQNMKGYRWLPVVQLNFNFRIK